ncbi:unnamed protein product [Blepharisma stoltei]|uniref:Importin subunit alpha n=1 Tax=Blepharisma stoltei TaxID=1481888 RepID=A0AAU9JG69_9CILI|nr:unnamed protein product [Blepharisma stoltei]
MSKKIDIQERNQQFLKEPGVEDYRRIHDDNLVQLRKKKRNEHLAKRRAFGTDRATQAEDSPEMVSDAIRFDISSVPEELAKYERQLVNPDLSPTNRLNTLISLIISSTSMDLLKLSVRTLRLVLTYDETNPCKYIGDSGISAKLIQCVLYPDKDLQYEAVWCITNLSSGEDKVVDELLRLNVIEALSKVFNENPSSDIANQAVWALGNIAGGSQEQRDKVVNCGIGEWIIKQISTSQRMTGTSLNTMVWTLANLLRGKTLQQASLFQEFLSISLKLLCLDNEDILSDTLWGFAYAMDGEVGRIQPVLNTGLGMRIVQLVGSESYKIKLPALRVIGNILLGDELQTQTIIDYGVIDQLVPLVNSQNKLLKKDAAWCISNICSGSVSQAEAILAHAGIASIVALLRDPDFSIKLEACYIFVNSTNRANSNLIINLLQYELIEELCQLIDHQDSRIVILSLQTIWNILKHSKAYMIFHNENTDRALPRLDEVGGISKIESLQGHRNYDIYQKATEVIKEFLGGEEVSQNAYQQGNFEF